MKSEQTGRLCFPLHPPSPCLTGARVPILNADISRHEQSRMRATYCSHAGGTYIWASQARARWTIVYVRSCKSAKTARAMADEAVAKNESGELPNLDCVTARPIRPFEMTLRVRNLRTTEMKLGGSNTTHTYTHACIRIRPTYEKQNFPARVVSRYTESP